jgi:hypothetical protein
MAKSVIPNPLERRHLIEKELPADQALAIADAYCEAGRLAEAVVFLRKAGADARLEQLAEEAIAEGDGFLLSEVARVRHWEPEPEAWSRLEESARGRGKLSYAETAHRQANRSDD